MHVKITNFKGSGKPDRRLVKAYKEKAYAGDNGRIEAGTVEIYVGKDEDDGEAVKGFKNFLQCLYDAWCKSCGYKTAPVDEKKKALIFVKYRTYGSWTDPRKNTNRKVVSVFYQGTEGFMSYLTKSFPYIHVTPERVSYEIPIETRPEKESLKIWPK